MKYIILILMFGLATSCSMKSLKKTSSNPLGPTSTFELVDLDKDGSISPQEFKKNSKTLKYNLFNPVISFSVILFIIIFIIFILNRSKERCI